MIGPAIMHETKAFYSFNSKEMCRFLMKQLGFVSHISKRGRIIVKAETVPKLNTEVFDKDSKPIGIIIDILGPVTSPYLAIKPYKKEDLEKLKNEKLYIK